MRCFKKLFAPSADNQHNETRGGPSSTTTPIPYDPHSRAHENLHHLPSTKPYQYQNLSRPRSIRVLRLYRGKGKSKTPYEQLPLHGDLHEVDLDGTSQYDALSYTWGEAVFSHEIIIDNCTLKLTANCAAALRRLLKGKSGRTLWVDSICINQADEAEKSRQVQIMGEVYSHAQTVRVHLGEGDEASDAAIQTLKGLSMAWIAARAAGPLLGLALDRYDRLKQDALEASITNGVEATSDQYPYGKLHGVFKLPWFERVWVVQEVAMAQIVVFYVGNHLMRLETLEIGANFTSLPTANVSPNERHWKSYIEVHSALREFIRRRSNGEELPFLTLTDIILSFTFTKKATNPKDKVYSLYGICERLGFRLPLPDYQKSLQTLYHETALCILEQDKSLKFLEQASCNSPIEGLPSWVPDLNRRIVEGLPAPVKGKATHSSEAIYELSPNGLQLRVLGRRFDKIVCRGASANVDLKTTMLGGAPRNTGEIFMQVIAAVVDWMEIARAVPHYPTGRDWGPAFCRTLVCDRIMDEEIQPALLAELRNTVYRMRHFQKMVSTINWDVAAQYYNQGPAQQLPKWFPSPSAMAELECIGICCTWKTFFRTERDFIGTATLNAQVGDQIVLLYGSDVPFVLRQMSEGWTVVGPAYIHGIMGGEFWDSSTAADDEPFVLV